MEEKCQNALRSQESLKGTQGSTMNRQKKAGEHRLKSRVKGRLSRQRKLINAGQKMTDEEKNKDGKFNTRGLENLQNKRRISKLTFKTMNSIHH